MKKFLMFVLLILCFSGPVFCGEFEDTLKKAEQGNAFAQYNLGWMYANGQGVTQDYKQAVGWYTKAAGQGYVLVICLDYLSCVEFELQGPGLLLIFGVIIFQQ